MTICRDYYRGKAVVIVNITLDWTLIIFCFNIGFVMNKPHKLLHFRTHTGIETQNSIETFTTVSELSLSFDNICCVKKLQNI